MQTLHLESATGTSLNFLHDIVKASYMTFVKASYMTFIKTSCMTFVKTSYMTLSKHPT